MSQVHLTDVDGLLIGSAVLVHDGGLFRSVQPKLDSWTGSFPGDVRQAAQGVLVAGGGRAPSDSGVSKAVARPAADATRPIHRAPSAASGAAPMNGGMAGRVLPNWPGQIAIRRSPEVKQFILHRFGGTIVPTW